MVPGLQGEAVYEDRRAVRLAALALGVFLRLVPQWLATGKAGAVALAALLAGCSDPAGVTRDVGFSADQTKQVVRFLAGKMPLYHAHLTEAPMWTPGTWAIGDPEDVRCDPAGDLERGTVWPTLHLEDDGRYRAGYNVTPGFAYIEVITRIGAPDSVIVGYHPGDHYCQFANGYGFKHLPRELDEHGGFDSFHAGMVQHVADYRGSTWRGEWSGFFQPVLDTGAKAALDRECEVRLRGNGTVTPGSERAVIAYSGTVCGHRLQLDIDVTSGGRATCRHEAESGTIVDGTTVWDWYPVRCGA